jgi:hypothetical protein
VLGLIGWIVFGFACGGDAPDSPLVGGGGGAGDSETCRVICNSCASGDEAAACNADCQGRIDELSAGFDLDACPDELAALGECLEATGCVGQSCDLAFLAWISCTGAAPP